MSRKRISTRQSSICERPKYAPRSKLKSSSWPWREAEATLAQITQEVKLQKEVHAADIRGLELEVEKHRLHVERHMRDLERLKMASPVDGLVVMESLYRGGGQTEQVQVGDQVNPGTFFMRVVDLSAMVVSGVVNQVDSQLVRMGQKAEVRLDAYPELVSTRQSHIDQRHGKQF